MARKKERLISSFALEDVPDLRLKGFLSNTIINIKLKIMNKKFSTFMTTGLLLSGALFCNVNAEETAKETNHEFNASLIGDDYVVKDLAEGDTLYFKNEADISGQDGKKFFIINTKNVTVLGKATYGKDGKKTAGTKLTGRIVIAAEGVKVKHVDFSNTSVDGIGGYWLKTSVTAFADEVSVDSCSFAAAATPATLTNGIVLYPQTDKVAYSLNGNTFDGLNKVVAGKDASGKKDITWYSSAIQVYKKTKVESDKNGDPLNDKLATSLSAYGKGSGNPAIDAAAIVKANAFKNCAADMVVRIGNELDAEGYSVEFAQVSKKVEEAAAPALLATKVVSALDGDLVAALVDAIQHSVKGTSIVVEGATAEEVVAILANADKVSTEVAKELADKNVAISTVKDNEPAGTVALGTVEVAGDDVIRIVYSEEGSSFVAPVAESIAANSNYILMTTDYKALQGAANGTATAAAFPTTIASGSTYDETYKPFLWSVTINKTEGYAKFTNVKTGKALLFDDAKTAAYIKLADGKVVVDNIQFKKLQDAITKASGNDSKVAGVDMSTGKFAAAAAPVMPDRLVKASELVATYGVSFHIGIDKGGKVLANDPFASGNLKPVVWKNIENGPEVIAPADLWANDKYNADTTRFMLQDENGKLIVMKKTEMYATATAGKYAYQLVTIDVETLAKAVKTGKDADYAAYFSIYVPYDNVIGKAETVSAITVEGRELAKGVYKLGSISLKDVNTLAACDKNDDFLDAISIKLAKFNTINVSALLGSGKYFTVTNKNTRSDYSGNFGKVLGLDNNGSAKFMKTNEVLVGYPETQWAITADKDGKTLTLKNREYPQASKTYEAKELYKTGDDNKYAVISSSYPYSDTDTIEIVAVKNPKATDGFKSFNAAKLKDQLFNLGSYSSVRDTVYIAENHKKDHQVGLVADKADATDWRLVPLMSQEEDVWGNPVKGTMTPTTICVVSEVNNGLGKTVKDTLKVQAYAFMNIENGEYMAYDTNRERYVTGGEKSSTGYDGNEDAHYFAVKIMGGDSTRFNLVAMQSYNKDYNYLQDLCPDQSNGDKELYYLNDADTCVYNNTYNSPLNKIYAGESNEGILNRYGMYQQNETDLFTITEKDAAEYLSLGQGDVIKIYRSEYAESESNVLYEKNGFLGVGNVKEFKDINPAIYVDRILGSTDHSEYLLGLNVTKIDTTYKCNEPSHSDLYHATDTVYARYLVNLADSAIAEDVKEDIHINKYIYNDGEEDYAKLAFVEGYCADDTLVYIKDQATGKYGKGMKITEAPQLFKFAFRVVDPETESFVVETGYKYPVSNSYDSDDEVSTGYLRYINGNIVVTSDIKEAEVFNLKEDSRKPVANEDIEASAISVIAGNGKVIVKGAAGKTVTISNVLGQKIANTVLSSDEAAISAPAGIVVVAVEGEAAVKAIVK